MTYWRSVLFVLFGACSYGVLSLFMKHAFALGFTPYEMSGSQLVFGGLIMIVAALFFSRERFQFKYLLILAPVSLMMA
ncbi:EamA family transporter, partial [Mesorhizobium sp. M00.F.Ca.ET.186.01.1.1]